MARNFRYYEKKRGHRRTGSRLFGSVGEAIFFAVLLTAWWRERGEDEVRRLRKKGRRSVQHLQDFIEKGGDRLSRAEKTLTRAVSTGKEVLDNIASKLD